MTLLSKMEVTSTGYKCIEQGDLRPIVDISIHESPSISASFSMQDEYVLHAKFEVYFRANDAQFAEARRVAKLHANNIIFGGITSELQKIIYLIKNGQKEESLNVAEGLLEEIASDVN